MFGLRLSPRLPSFLQSALGEYRQLIRLVKRAGLLFLAVFAAATVFPDTISGWSHPPNVFLGWMGNSFAVTVLVTMERSLLPHGITLIVIGPFDAFTVIMVVGAYLALAATLPYLVLGFLRWLAPALSRRESRFIRSLATGSSVLFFSGMVFTYLVILPPIYQFSYSLQPAVGAVGTISLQAFVETSFMFMLLTGLAFELPVLLLGVAYAGFLTAFTMKLYAPLAYLGFFLVAFFISPGVGGGIVETILASVLFGLYLLSYTFIRRLELNRKWRIPVHVGA